MQGCQIASFKQRDCNKALTVIRTNVEQKKQIKAKLSLVGTLCGGSRKVEQGVYSHVWELLMLTRWISDMFTFAFGAQLSDFKWWSDAESGRNTHIVWGGGITHLHADPSWKINGCKFEPILYRISVRFPKQVESIGGGLPITKQSLLFINRLFLWMTRLRPSGPLSHLPTNNLGIWESGAICINFTHWFLSEMKVGAQICSDNWEELFISTRI